MSEHPGQQTKVYLAGPEVFLPDAQNQADLKKSLCTRYHLVGIFPLDNDIKAEDLPKQQQALEIAASNEQLIRRCDAVIANLTPFRGPSADVGTVYEVGFAKGLGKPVFGYTNDPRLFSRRVVEDYCPTASESLTDPEGLSIEDFALHDNLMIDGALARFGTIHSPASLTDDRWRDLEAFERCLQAVSQYFRSKA